MKSKITEKHDEHKTSINANADQWPSTKFGELASQAEPFKYTDNYAYITTFIHI